MFLAFWMKHNVYFEQPDVTYRRELIILLEGQSGTPMLWSTFPKFRQLLAEYIVTPEIKVEYQSSKCLF
jgi:hypothetical protein